MIYPDAIWRPGANAGYRAGRNQLRLCVAHYTAGRLPGDLSVMDRGYFNFLVARDGTVYQGAEADALTYHAGPANAFGPGIEVSYHPDYDDDLWTPAAYAATGRLVDWLIALAIAPTFYDGPRVDPSGITGFITHRSIEQGADGHSDWWPDLPRASSSPTRGVPNMCIVWGQTVFGVPVAALVAGHKKILDLSGPAGAYGVPQKALDWRAVPGRDAVPLVLCDPQSLAVLVA